MDRVDSEILGILERNARTSFSELGRQVGLSTNAAAARVRRMERDGIILGYTVRTSRELAPRRLGLEVFVDLRLDPDTDNETFMAAIQPIPEIVDAAHVTGPYDYLLQVWVHDTAALDAVLRRLKKHCGAAQTHTRVALREPRQRQ